MIQAVISFDTTGSMYPCIRTVRNRVKEIGRKLHEVIDEPLELGVIAHGDYCDVDKTYVTKSLDLTSDLGAFSRFVTSVEKTGGGDNDECYELVLHKIRQMSWKAGAKKIFLLIGDAKPHEVGYRWREHTNMLDWRNEAHLLKEAGVNIYAVQCLGYRDSTPFYEELASLGAGHRIELDQFDEAYYLILACIYREYGQEQLDFFEAQAPDTRGVHKIFDALQGRTRERVYETHGLIPVSPHRFQAMEVPYDQPIRDFVEDHGIKFQVGRGFYELTKRVLVQHHKEIILQDRVTGDFFTGDDARSRVGLPFGRDAKLSPAYDPKYRVFIQSTSWNRKLLRGTKFLYEVDERVY